MTFCQACYAARQHELDWAPPDGECVHEHPQVLLRAHGNETYVDHDIQGLISELWSRRVRTYNSCQGGYRLPGYVQYHADDHDDAVRVLAPLDPEYEEPHRGWLAEPQVRCARWMVPGLRAGLPWTRPAPRSRRL